MPTEISSPEIIFVLAKWLIILVIWAWLALNVYNDSSKIRKQRDSSSVITDLMYMLHRRNLQLFGLVSMLLVIAVASDISHTMENQQAVPEKPPEVAKSAPSSADQSADAAKYALPHDSKIPYADITEFNEANSKQQAYTDLLKERYETWLITYYYLQKCGKVSPQDLDIIMGSLRKELQSVHADNSVEGNITLAANGSYKEMYSDIPCDAAHISTTKAGYDASMKQITPQAQANAAPIATDEKPQLKPEPNGKSAPVTPVAQAPIVPATLTPGGR